MIELHGQAIISDYMLHTEMDVKELNKIVRRQISNGMAEKLANSEEFQVMTISRNRPEMFNEGETVYKSKVFILTEEEAREYKALKNIQVAEHYKPKPFGNPFDKW